MAVDKEINFIKITEKKTAFAPLVDRKSETWSH